MGRPAKPITLTDGKRTNEVKNRRRAAENRLRGDRPVKVPEGLSRQQKSIAKGIIEALEGSSLLCSLDETILAEAAFSIDGIRACIYEHNTMMQKIADGDAEPEDDRMNDPNFRQKLKKYEETFLNACKELGLSPQARAKIAVAGTTGKDESLEAIKKIIGGEAVPV